MVKKILLLLFSLIMISIAFNYYIEKKLSTIFSKIQPRNLQYLEHRSNANFYAHGIAWLAMKKGENISCHISSIIMKNLCNTKTNCPFSENVEPMPIADSPFNLSSFLIV